MKNKYYIYLVSLALLLCILSCGKKEEKTEVEAQVADNLKVPAFNEDSAYNFIKRQVSFGPRVPNLPAHVKCGNYLIEKLKAVKAEVTVQEFESKAFNGKVLKLRNIIGSFKSNNSKRILLAAHWDSRPFADKDTINPEKPILGASDGASGVGVLLEVARILSSNPSYNVGVDVIFFDGEDYGDTATNTIETWCLGSQYWAKNKHSANYSAYYGILLDMVGAKGATFPKEEYSIKYARQIVENVWAAADTLGYGNYFMESQNGAITDDHRFVNEIAKIPMIDIIDLHPLEGFGAYHHTHRDNMDIIDKNTLKAVGQTLLYVLYHEETQEAL